MENSESKKQTFIQYMGDNYYPIKNKLQNICNGFNNILFDEDIFHDTILKIDSVLLKKCLPDNDYEKYMCKSFRTNLVRDKLYHRNSMTEHTFDFDGIEPYTLPYVVHTIDLKQVISILDKKFGSRYTRAYIDWLSGYNINELNIESAYYHIKQMTNYIRSYRIHDNLLY